MTVRVVSAPKLVGLSLRRDERHAVEHLLVVRQRVGAGERQRLGRRVVARRDAGAGGVGRQHVAVAREAPPTIFTVALASVRLSTSLTVAARRQRHRRGILDVGGARRHVAQHRRVVAPVTVMLTGWVELSPLLSVTVTS